jgi:hypothetical protein
MISKNILPNRPQAGNYYLSREITSTAVVGSKIGASVLNMDLRVMLCLLICHIVVQLVLPGRIVAK